MNDLIPKKYQDSKVIAQAKALKVTDDYTNLVAVSIGKIYKEEMKVRTDYFEPKKKKAKSVHSDWVQAEKEAVAPYKEAISILKTEMLKYEQKQEAIRREKEAELRRKAEEAQKAIEAKAEKDGLEIEPSSFEPEDIVVNATYTAQGQTRANWKAEVTDKVAFIKWCVKNKRWDFLEPNMVLLTQEAKGTKQESPIDGVRYYNDPIKVF